ncbi:hemolysin III family protein [Phycisphaerales bacterium AB-hyl4]|uniref:Hemolysin III family protein n=1 Tax=Natronomicrosphaera hydrolytica TaxID=3242702 RepID=A0ABV4U546_9BACT
MSTVQRWYKPLLRGDKIKAEYQETRQEEWASALTHAVGVVLAVVAAVLMLQHARQHGDAWHIVTVAIFGITLVAVYLASTLYHGVCHPRWRRALLTCDYVCIYLLIAGSYTPFALVTIGGQVGWSIFGVIWGLAIIGVLLKLRFCDRFPLVSTGIYLAMGWMAVCFSVPAIEAMSTTGLVWLGAGGLAYTFGVAVYLWRHLPFNHAIWHLFVIAGSACHVTAIFHDVLPALPA